MSRRVPKLQHHKASGKARVRIGGRDFYCGPWGTPKAEAEYNRLIAEYLVTGRAPEPDRRSDSISINELLVAFLRHAETYYVKGGKQTAEVHCLKSAMRPLKALYGTMPVDDFGPLALQAVRSKMIEAGWTRGFVNKSIGRIRLIFRWGVANQLVRPETLTALQAVSGLQQGRTNAPDNPERQPVPQAHIDAVKAKVRQRTRDLIDLQLLTGARSGELLKLTTAMIDRSQPVWTAKIRDHKTQHKGKVRILYFGPKAQLILRRYIHDAEPEQRLFPIRRESYGNTVHAACLRAGVPVFTPHWLRHTAATALREEHGLEAAQVLLGHSKADVTQIYAKANQQAAIAVAQKIG